MNLSRRDLELLRLMADGHTVRDTAAAMFVSPTTVKTMRERIFAELGARNAPHAVAIAHRRGYLGADPVTADDLATARRARQMGYRLALVRLETP